MALCTDPVAGGSVVKSWGREQVWLELRQSGKVRMAVSGASDGAEPWRFIFILSTAEILVRLYKQRR